MFSLGWINRIDSNNREFDVLVDDFVDMIEARKLRFSGAFSPSGGNGVVTTDSRRSMTAADRDFVLAWLRNRSEVSTVEAGEVVDRWGYRP